MITRIGMKKRTMMKKLQKFFTLYVMTVNQKKFKLLLSV